MKPIKSVPIVFQGKQYEVRAERVTNGIVIKTLYDNKVINENFEDTLIVDTLKLSFYTGKGFHFWETEFDVEIEKVKQGQYLKN